ncbi:DNA repair protein RAD50-like [Sycon ciliatum]|uniref:DNA repair protein RAD50-like n=1 Tax=Sycon ciliatum TaxID=27933 RepID=UPI0031F717B8
MSRLDKLSICGVRSFSHTEKVVVKIYSPLTLIVGQNGAGKTTIIECLKYATTGEFPPGPKTGAMGAFIHDPKVAGEREVKANIALKFVDVRGNVVCITRRMQAVQMASRITSKTVESTIQKECNGEKASISSRCADIDREMVSLLGVSRAVLSNVIFCHQEDSAWPLSDGKMLKTKFDEIFAATRYIKALENIRKFRKDQDGTLRELNLELKYLREHKEKAAELGDQKATAEDRIASAKECVAQVTAKLQPIEERLAELQQVAQQWYELEKEIEVLGHQHSEKDRQIIELRSRINVVDGTMDDLEGMLADSKNRLNREKTALQKQTSQRTDLDREQRQLSESRNRLAREHGRLEQEAEAHRNSVKKRDELAVKLAQLMKKPEFSRGSFDEERSTAFLRNLKGEVEGLINGHRQQKQEHAAEQERQQRDIDTINSNLTKLAEAKRYKSKLKAENDQKLQQIARGLREVSGAEGKLNIAELDMKQAEEALKSAEEDSTHELDREQIGQLEREKKVLDREISELTTEVSRAHQYTKTRAELDILKKTRLAKEEAIKKIERDHDDTLVKLFGGTLPENLQEAFQGQLRERRDNMRDVKKRSGELSSRLRTQETDKSYHQKQLKQHERELQGFERRVEAVCREGEVNQTLKEVETKIESLQDDLAVTGAAPKFFNLLRKLLEKNHSCPVCDRNFQRESKEMEVVVKKLADKGAAMPQNKQKMQSDLTAARAELKKLQNIRPLVDNMAEIRQRKIPDTKKKISELDEQIGSLTEQSDELAEEEALADAELGELEPLDSDIKMLQSHRVDLAKLERSIAEKQGSLRGSSKSIQALTQELQQKQIDSESKSRQLELTRQRVTDYDRNILNLRKTMQNARERKLEITDQMQRSQKLQEQKVELAGSNQNLSREIQEAERKLEPLQRKLTEQEDARRRQKEEHSASEEKELQGINDIRGKAAKIKETTDRINEYNSQGKGDEVQRAHSQLEQISKRLATTEEERTKVDEQISKLNKSVASHQVHERAISDSMDILRYEDEMIVIDNRVQELRDKLGSATRKNSKREREKLEEQEQELKRERTRHEGRQFGLEEEIKRLRRELASDMYKDADAKYREYHIKVKTTELSNTDLDRYYKALDKAIMRYHGLKMGEINRIIRDLWMKTYRGNDIDTIEIVSDVEEDAEKRTTARRSYNYRVVMRKGDTALDMRARCSAGQKVLACLIIRLALAETFCLTCGILALDEPTTNLDRDNIDSLAQALADIIKDRQRQKNFQLVIITHDEEFVDMLGRSEYVDYYYKVQKDDNHCSKVWRRSIQGDGQQLEE